MSKRVKLVPLLHEGADDVERALLASARRDGPPDSSARQRTLEAVKAASGAAVVAAAGVGVARWLPALKPGLLSWLAVGGVVAAATVGAAVLVAAPDEGDPAAGAVTSQPPLVPAPPKATPADAGLLPKAAPLAASAASKSAPVGSATVATATLPVTAPTAPHPATLPAPPLDRSGEPERLRSTAPSSTGATAPGSALALEVTPRAADPAPPLDPSPALPLATPQASAPPAPSSSAGPSPAPTSLHDEAALLESVRASLATSHVARALTLLDAYDARFAAGALAEEAVVLRVQALLAAGRREDARRIADDFARRYPGSSYVPRVRALIDSKGENAGVLPARRPIDSIEKK